MKIETKTPTLLERLKLVDSPRSKAFDAITRLAMRLLNVSVALISIVEEERDRQYFTSEQGLGEPWKAQRQTPISHSFCQYVKRSGKPLVVPNSKLHPTVCDNPAIQDLNVMAYLGVPICGPDGTEIGALCVIEDSPRDWTQEELGLLEDLARCVNDEIMLRAALLREDEKHKRDMRANRLRESISLAFMAPNLSLEERFETLLTSACAAFEMEKGSFVRVNGDTCQVIASTDQEEAPESTLASRSLTAAVNAKREVIAWSNGHAYAVNPASSCSTQQPLASLGCPLIVDGVFFGSLEFTSQDPRQEGWNEDDFAMLSTVAMFAAAHLEIYCQLAALQRSESALLAYIADEPGQMSPSGNCASCTGAPRTLQETR